MTGQHAPGEPGASIRLVRPGELSPDTAQTSGMRRAAAISGALTGARSLWMGTTVMPPGTVSGDHHHGDSETAIYVVSGHPVFAFRDPATGELARLQAAPGDFVWVPPRVPHREENPGGTEAVVVIARSTQEAVVQNVPSL